MGVEEDQCVEKYTRMVRMRLGNSGPFVIYL